MRTETRIGQQWVEDYKARRWSVGLDLGRRTGYAVADRGEIVKAGSFYLGRGIKRGRTLIPHRRMRRRLCRLHMALPFRDLIVEQLTHQPSIAAQLVHCGLFTVVGMWCMDNQVKAEEYNNSTIKKYATGNGRAGKIEMVRAARAKWPNVRIPGPDAADAAWLLDFHLTQVWAEEYES